MRFSIVSHNFAHTFRHAVSRSESQFQLHAAISLRVTEIFRNSSPFQLSKNLQSMEKSLNPEDTLPNIPIHFHTNFNVRRKFEVYQCPTNIDVPCHTKYQFPSKSLPFTNKNSTDSSSNDPNSCNRFKLGWFSRKPRLYHFSASEKERNNVARGSRRSPKLYKDLHIRNAGKISSAKLENVCVSPRTLLRQHRSLRGVSFPAVQDPHNTASLAFGAIFRENTLPS